MRTIQQAADHTTTETDANMPCAGDWASGNSPFEGRHSIFKHELGALYVACLLLESPRGPIHAVALALKASDLNGQGAGAGEVVQQRSMGLDDAATVRALWRRQRMLERVLEDEQETEPVKAEALRELEEVGNSACYLSNRFCGPIQGEMKAKSKVRGAESKVQSPRSGNEHPVKNRLRRLLIWLH